MASWFTVRYAVKEANRQNPVLTNRNVVRGIIIRVSNHIIVTPKEHQKGNYVDHAVIGGRIMLLPGESSEITC